MSFRTFSKLTAATLTLLAGYAVGCASVPPPPELLDARAVYTRAAAGPAAQIKPDSLHEAQVALEQAEKAYVDDPGAQQTRDIAYVAARRSELAEVEASDAKAAQDKAKAEKEIASLTQAQLANTRQQLASAADNLANERSMRQAADKRAKEALDKLAASASVKQDSRGTVITLPGNVLFGSAKTTLLPGAQSRLNSVADALKETDSDILVEGHTDSQGSHESNIKLSQARAQNVRDYLVQRGVPSGRIRAQGLGESQPIADNATGEGRASNRRVEIVVTSAGGTSPTERKPSSGGAPMDNK